MFINKIMNVTNVGFKGYNHKKNNVGETVMRFNYPYDSEKETCEIEFYRVKRLPNFNCQIDETKPIHIQPLTPDGVDVNLQNITDLDTEEAFAYKVIRKNKEDGKVVWKGPDTGLRVRKNEKGEFVFRVHQDHFYQGKDVSKKETAGHDRFAGPDNYEYNLVTRKGTAPIVQGAGYLIMPDSFRPGTRMAKFNEPNTGELVVDKAYQKEMEGIDRNFSNKYGGNIAGIIEKIPYLVENGYKHIFMLPIANGDNVSSHGYWNKNNMQIAPTMGSLEDYKTLTKELYKNGRTMVFDGTFTSEGLEGIHIQYALRWADQNPETELWFRTLKDTAVGFGVVPKNADNFRHRIINAPYNYELQSNGTYKKVPNENYNSKKETYVQIYDSLQASERQIKDYDKAIERYENLKLGNELDIKNYDDTLINYVFEIRDWSEYQKRIDVINDLNKSGENIKLDSPEGSMLACSFSNFNFARDPENYVAWDAQKDMIKMNYFISGYDEKLLQAITDRDEREHAKKNIIQANCKAQDLALQVFSYQTQLTNDVQNIYTAQQLGSAKTVEAINKLIQEKKLPEEVALNSEELNNILNGDYMLAPKGVLAKDDITIKSLMKLPLDAIEFGEKTQGVLSTSYFSNRAIDKETLGISRFDLLNDKNPHLAEPFANVYNKTNALFQNEIREFAHSVIEKVNETSSEKLLDTNGDYTEYGEYVIDLVGREIARYAFLKSLSGESFKTKVLEDGSITYDYEAIRENTSLKALGINATNPTNEAKALLNKMEKGLKKLSDEDISFVAGSINKTINGTDTQSFRIAEAMVNKSGLGLNWRLDAAKDLADMDAGRNLDNSFVENWLNIIGFWNQATQIIKTVNPHSNIVAEMTDVSDLMKDEFGSSSCPYNNMTNIGQMFNGEPDAMIKFFNESGITAEAAYSFLFTSVIQSFGKSFENGEIEAGWIQNYKYPRHDIFKEKMDLLMQTKSLDYLRNLYTFVGNHDKTRTIHALALDMELFFANLNDIKKDTHKTHMLEAFKAVSGAQSVNDIPIELRLNLENKDYPRTMSSQAIAMSKHLKDVLNEDMKGLIDADQLQKLNNAIADITNGSYLGKGEAINYQSVNIKELSTMENAFRTILEMAEKRGLNLTDSEKNQWIETLVNKANRDSCLNNYQIHGDLDYTDENYVENYKQTNDNYAKEIVGSGSDYKKYSLFSIQLARLFKDSYASSGLKQSDAINSALKDFAEKFNLAFVKSHTKAVPKFEDEAMSIKKNTYAARDIKRALEMVVRQAEFKAGKEFANKQQIIENAYKYATEPAAAKFAMIMEYLSAIFGIPTIFAGDEMAMTGGEKKAKNIDLQNRNALPWTDSDEKSLIGEYRRTAMSAINGAFSNRSNPELHSLNDGTPYFMDVRVNGRNRNEVQQRLADISEMLKNTEISDAEKISLEDESRQLTKDLAKVAYMMQSSNGDMAVAMLYNGNISHYNRHNYFKDFKDVNLEEMTPEERIKYMEKNNIYSLNPNNKYVPIQDKVEMDAIMLGTGIALPLGTLFFNANVKDKAQYIVKKIGESLGIARADGGKIIMDASNSKNGVMVLKHIKNKIPFRGRQQQYKIVSNPYKNNEPVEQGKNLSLISR